MKSPQTTRRIIEALAGLYPGADTELHYRNAFELLVATMLSAQSTDARVNMVTPALFARYPNAKALAAATPEELEPQILSTGFFRRSRRRSVTMAQILVPGSRRSGPGPTWDALTTLPGVGRKTANVVLGHALGVRACPVDRHVLRVANRIGIAEGTIRWRWRSQALLRGSRRMWTLASDVRSCTAAASAAPPTRSAISARWRTIASTSPRSNARSRVSEREAHGHAKSHREVRRAATQGRAANDARRLERLGRRAITLIPRRFRAEMRNIAIVVEDEPSDETLDAMEIEPPDSLYGLYEGTPLPERQWADGNRLPDRVTIFQRPIEEDCEDEDDVRAVIGETLIHEIGHYFGLSEEEIEEIEERYWRGETLGPDEDDEE
jgi:endonuclease-3